MPELEPMDDPQEGTAHEASVTLFVGLVLLLLAFFVMLNNASRLEAARTRAVMGSVVVAFDPLRPAANSRFAFTSDLGEVPVDARLPDRLGKLVETHIPTSSIEVVRPSRILQIKVPGSRLWDGGGAALSFEGERFLAALAELIRDPPRGLRYEVDARLGRAPGAEDGEAQGPTLEVVRVAGVAEMLEAAGVPPDDLTAGIDANSGGALRLILYVRSGARPPARFTFRGEAP